MKPISRDLPLPLVLLGWGNSPGNPCHPPSYPKNLSLSYQYRGRNILIPPPSITLSVGRQSSLILGLLKVPWQWGPGGILHRLVLKHPKLLSEALFALLWFSFPYSEGSEPS